MTTVDIVIPVYNEEKALPGSVEQLRAFLADVFLPDWRIVIADNASVDRTPVVGAALADEYPDVRYLRLEQKGRGRALRTAWLASDADILSYMDVDLSTNLSAFPPMIDSIVTRGYDLAIGSRLMSASRTTRSLKREVISRGYNALITLLFRQHFSDAQCGFKAITHRAAHDLVPLVEDQTWFFDTELLLRAEQRGYRIAEVPVEWIEDLDSRVKIARTALDDVRGLLRVRFGSPSGPG
ncbi:MAG: dolichyl-phosphate beta-glucosyltransferase [Dehalococcoidia bacterium]